MRSRPIVFMFLISTLLAPIGVRAQWKLNGAPVCTAAGYQQAGGIVSDGSGGMIIAWQDSRSGTYDIYVQRVDGFGVPEWTANGVAICAASNNQVDPLMVSDGLGGAVVIWKDYRSGTSYDIYAQRVDASGITQWTYNGVALCTAGNDQGYASIASDGAGGAIAVWQDYRSGAGYDIYAQGVDVTGAPRWTTNGVAVCTATGNQNAPVVASDGSGNAIIAWADPRSGTNDIYAQRVTSSGVAAWTTNGVAVCTATNVQNTPAILPDGAAGAIVTWGDYRYSISSIFAQRLAVSGVSLWATNGVAVCTASNGQYAPRMVEDGNGGAIITWYDVRNADEDIYAQRVDASGTPQWTENGVPVCTSTAAQREPELVSDGAGGAIIGWRDFRGSTATDVYAQRVDALGAAQWGYNGVSVSSASGNEAGQILVEDGTGGAIIAWQDSRSGAAHIYAQRVEGTYGYWGHPEPVVTSVADIPNDQGGKVAVDWLASGRDLPVPRTISYYTIWRAIDMLPASGAGQAPVVVSDLSQVKEDAFGPVYLSTPPTSEVPGYYWELVGTQSAHGWPGYAFTADTQADSVAGDPGTATFMVAAHIQYDDYVAFSSNALSGHSVDNLAPASPLYLTAQRVNADVELQWNGVHVPDLKNYSVYRATASGVTPIPTNFLADEMDTVLVDSNAPTSALYYIVAANDVHQNQSTPSNEASVSALTGVGNTPSIAALTVLQNHPNPFAGATELEIGLPEASRIEIEVYDVEGHRVRTQTVTGVKGWQGVPLAGVDDSGSRLASGVYFCRVHARGETITRKMVIAR